MLSGWPNVYKLKIDSSKIESDLNNFPVQINLSADSGINSFDASKIFDDLGVSTYNEYFTAPDGTSNPDPNKWYVYENPLSTFEVKNNKMYYNIPNYEYLNVEHNRDLEEDIYEGESAEHFNINEFEHKKVSFCQF
jgi:hypothetical protein